MFSSYNIKSYYFLFFSTSFINSLCNIFSLAVPALSPAITDIGINIISPLNLAIVLSSIKVNNPKDTAIVYKYLLEQGHVAVENFTTPTSMYQMPYFDIWFSYYSCNKLTDFQCQEAERLIPSLVKSYLKLGAKIASIPAFDKEFDCIDVLTVLKKEDVANSVARRFQMVQ